MLNSYNLNFNKNPLVQKTFQLLPFRGVAVSFNASINFSVDLFYPSLQNNVEVHKKIERVAKE